MSDNAPLFMLRAEFDQPALMRFAARTGLDLRVTDGGYILHAATRALWGDAAPRPFVTRESHGRRLVMFGYAPTDHRELADRVRAIADPLAVAAIDLDSLCSKRMPAAWRAGVQYRFETRVCPVTRVSGRSTHERPHEMDVFLHRCRREGADAFVDRQAVYCNWLEREFARDGAARLRDTRLLRFHRQRLGRRDRSGPYPRLIRCERPDATLAGVVEVVSPEAFAGLMRRGVGRHRAFGFGMLLLSH